MDKSLAIIQPDMTTRELGEVLTKSGYFQDARDVSQAIVKILAGRELGFGAIASMTGFYIVKGHVSMSANLMAAAVKRSGRYDYRVQALNDDACTIKFYEVAGGQRVELGESKFTMADAKRAGTGNTDKFPRNMLFARAMSNGVKWFCPDVTGGPVYTPDELGAVVDNETGEVITSERPSIPPTSEPSPKSWNAEVVAWACKEWKTSSYQIVNALKQSKVITPGTPDTDIQRWLTVRKVDRDAGVDGATASLHADMDYTATHVQPEPENDPND